MKSLLAIFILTTSCVITKPSPPFEVSDMLWVECRNICEGPGKNSKVSEFECICKRGARFHHSLTPKEETKEKGLFDF